MKAVKVVIVEDEVIHAMLLKKQLSRLGINNIVIVSNGLQTLEYVEKEGPPDLLIMDIGLHGPLDGIQTVKKLQEKDRIPVIYMTGYEDQKTRQAAGETFFIDFLIKPVNPSHILDLVEKTVHSSL